MFRRENRQIIGSIRVVDTPVPRLGVRAQDCVRRVSTRAASRKAAPVLKRDAYQASNIAEANVAYLARVDEVVERGRHLGWLP